MALPPEDVDDFKFNESNIQRLKDLLSNQLAEDQDQNPLKVCMKLIFESSIEQNPDKRNELSLKLCDFLIKPGGLMYLFLSMLDFDKTSQRTTTHNQRFSAVANIITGLPKLSLSYEDYCRNIYNQLLSLLINDNPNYSNLGCIIVKTMIECPRGERCTRIDEIITRPLHEGLLTHNGPLRPRETIIAVNNLVQNNLPVKLLVETFRPLLSALVTLQPTASRLKVIIKSSLIGILNGLAPGPACCLIEEALSQPCRGYQIDTQDDEISVNLCDLDVVLASPDNETCRDVIISLIDTCQNDLLVLEFFFHFRQVMWESHDSYLSQLSASLVEPLIVRMTDETSDSDGQHPNLLEIFVKHPAKSLELIHRTLLGYVDFLRFDTGESMRLKLAIDSMTSCLGILEVLSLTISDESDCSIIVDKCIPTLKEIGRIAQDNLGNEATCKKLKPFLKTVSSTIQELDRQWSRNRDDIKNKCREAKDHQELNSLIKDLNNKLVPVRVHALVRLKQMISANEPHAMSQIIRIRGMIEASLADCEPYVFLACINLMAEIAIRETRDTLPILLQLYLKQEFEVQHRMNVGEVLVRITRQLNRTAPHYANDLIHVFLQGCKEPEELIRMSSLTNIGEVCGNLGESLGKYYVEILTCVDDILETDTIQVKCAALNLLRTTLAGLDKSNVGSIESDLARTYKILKRVRAKTLDDTFCLQADLALDEIDKLARNMLGLDVEQTSPMVKNIEVLNLLR